MVAVSVDVSNKPQKPVRGEGSVEGSGSAKGGRNGGGGEPSKTSGA